jgi:hypothetical protein
MTGRILAGVLLIVLGIGGLAYGGFSFTHSKNVVDLGPVEVTKNEHERLPLPPIVSGLFVVAGVLLLVVRGGGSKV